MICIMMALGLIGLPALAGIVIGYYVRKIHLLYSLVFIVIFNSSFYVYDVVDTSKIISNTSTSVIINANKEKVWQVLTHPVTFEKSNHLMFKAGISYPLSMQIDRRSNDCFLQCKLNNGLYNLKLIQIDTLQRIRFQLPENVVPMKELSIYKTIDAPHLQGYFKPVYGEFVIHAVNPNQCRLEANTLYSYKITPVFYWRWWSDYIVNHMHEQVLNNIKVQSE
jgi:hypothetical protein